MSRIGIAASHHTHGTAGHLVKPEEVEPVEGDVQDAVEPYDPNWDASRPRLRQLRSCFTPVVD